MVRTLILAAFIFLTQPLAAQDVNSFVQSLDTKLRRMHRPEVCDNDTLSSKLSSRRTARFQGLEATVLSEKEAQDLFKEFQNDKDLAFNFPDAGCWERTYEMSRRLLEKGITPLKSFLNSEGDRGALIRIAHPNQKNKYLNWNNHVAPVVLVEKDGRLIPFTLDPTLENAAVPTTQWQANILKIKPPGQVSLTYMPAERSRPGSLTPLNYSSSESIQSNLAALKLFRELGDDPEKAAEWYFQKYNEELKAGGNY